MKKLSNNDILKKAIEAGDVEKVKCIIGTLGLCYKDTWYGGYNPLCYALTMKQLECAQEILEAGADINCCPLNQFQPLLHLAVSADSLDFLQELLKRKLKWMNAANLKGETPLHVAVQNKNVQMIRMLISHEANVNIISYTMESPLQLAINENSIDIVNILLSAGAEVTINSLFTAAYVENMNILILLLEKIANINDTVGNGHTALHRLCIQSTLQVCKLLIQYGADINKADDYGQTPLLLATNENKVEVIEFLLDNKPDFHVTGNKLAFLKASFKVDVHLLILKKFIEKGFFFDPKQTSNVDLLVSAINKQNIQLFQNLLSVNVLDIETVIPISFSKEKDYITLLQYAVIYSAIDVVRLLLKYGANVHVKDRYGRSILFLLLLQESNKSYMDLIKIVKELVKYGADVNATLEDGTTVLHFAAIFNVDLDDGYRPDYLIDELLKCGANVNVRMHHNLTPLHLALQEKNIINATRLLKADADINAQDDIGRTPLHIMASTGIIRKNKIFSEFFMMCEPNITTNDFKGRTAREIDVEYDRQLRLNNKSVIDVYKLEGVSVETNIPGKIPPTSACERLMFNDFRYYRSEYSTEIIRSFASMDIVRDQVYSNNVNAEGLGAFEKYNKFVETRNRILNMRKKDLQRLILSPDVKEIEKCIAREVQYLRNDVIHGNFTFYDVVKSKCQVVAKYMWNEECADKLAYENYRSRYTYFRRLLKKIIDTAQKHYLVKCAGHNFYQFLENRLYDNVIHEIMKYLPAKDLKSIIEATTDFGTK